MGSVSNFSNNSKKSYNFSNKSYRSCLDTQSKSVYIVESRRRNTEKKALYSQYEWDDDDIIEEHDDNEGTLRISSATSTRQRQTSSVFQSTSWKRISTSFRTALSLLCAPIYWILMQSFVFEKWLLNHRNRSVAAAALASTDTPNLHRDHHLASSSRESRNIHRENNVVSNESRTTNSHRDLNNLTSETSRIYNLRNTSGQTNREHNFASGDSRVLNEDYNVSLSSRDISRNLHEQEQEHSLSRYPNVPPHKCKLPNPPTGSGHVQTGAGFMRNGASASRRNLRATDGGGGGGGFGCSPWLLLFFLLSALALPAILYYSGECNKLKTSKYVIFIGMQFFFIRGRRH